MGNASIASPGPIFPVNLKLSTSSEIVVGWYDDPNNNDGLLAPQSQKYLQNGEKRVISLPMIPTSLNLLAKSEKNSHCQPVW